MALMTRITKEVKGRAPLRLFRLDLVKLDQVQFVLGNLATRSFGYRSCGG